MLYVDGRTSRAASACRSAPAASLVRVEARRRAGGVRVGEHAAADDPRRRQLRAPRRRLARGRPRRRLREVHPRRRPARDDARPSSRASTCRENGQALDAIRENGPGPALPRHAPTRSPTSRTRSTARTIADNASYEQWLEDGALDAAQRANAIWKRRLAEYEPPPIDDAHRRGAPRVHRPAQGRPARLGRLSRVLFRRHSRLTAARAGRSPRVLACADVRARPAQERPRPGRLPAAPAPPCR